MLRPVSLYLPQQRSISPAAEGFIAFLVDWVPRQIGTPGLGPASAGSAAPTSTHG